MAEFGKVARWLDFRGRSWPVIQSPRRLKFKYPAHAALRAHVFSRDNFSCKRCAAVGRCVPPDYDGRNALFTNTNVSSGGPDMLVLDHIVTLKAGGKNIVGNLQTLCETCNKRKQKEDRTAVESYLRSNK